MSNRRNADGFTLVELLVVVIILGVLAGVVVFGISRFRDNAVDSACRADVKQVNTAAAAYVEKYQTAAPSTAVFGEFLPKYPASDNYTVNYAPGAGTNYSVSATKTNGSACGAGSTGGGGGGAVATTFIVAAPATATAGQSISVTITADTGGSTDTSYTGAKAIVFSGPGNSPGGTAPTYPATVNFVAGVGTANVTLTKAETVSLAATESGRTGSDSIVVNADAPTGLCIASAPSCTGSTTPDVGNAGSFTSAVSLRDALGNTATATAPVSINLGFTTTSSGSPTLTPTGAGALSIAAGQTTSSASFTGSLPSGANKNMTVTASVASGLSPATVVIVH